MDTVNTSGIDVILSNPFVLLVGLLTLFFFTVLVYALNSSVDDKSKSPEKLNEKILEVSKKYRVEVLNQRRPLMLFGMLLALIVYNIIAWFVTYQSDSTVIKLFYEFFTGFVSFLLVWICWINLSGLLVKIFLLNHPSLDVRTYLEKRTPRLILKYTFFWTLIYNIGFPLIIILIFSGLYPRVFFVGVLAVLILGLIQNLGGLIKVSRS